MTDDLVERLLAGADRCRKVSAGEAAGNLPELIQMAYYRLSEAADAILKLQGEVAEARDDYQRAHQRAADAIRHGIEFEHRLEAAEAEVARMREALAAAKVKPLDMWEAMDAARKPGEPTT